MKTKTTIITLFLIFLTTFHHPIYAMEDFSRPLKVKIYGGGIAGLMASIVLLKQGHIVIMNDKRSFEDLFKRCDYYVTLKESVAEYLDKFNLLENFEKFPGIDIIEKHEINGISNLQKSKYAASISTIQGFLYSEIEKMNINKDKFFYYKNDQEFTNIERESDIDLQIWACGANSLPSDIDVIVKQKNKKEEIWEFSAITLEEEAKINSTQVFTDRIKDENHIYHFSDKKIIIAKSINFENYQENNKSQIKITHRYAAKFYDKNKKLIILGDSIVASTPRMGMGASLALTKYPIALLQFIEDLENKNDDHRYNEYTKAMNECIYDWLIQGNNKFNLNLDLPLIHTLNFN